MQPRNKIKSLPSESSPTIKKKQIIQLSSLKRIHTLSTDPFPTRKQPFRYDAALFHKTNFHLKPHIDNPQFFTRDKSLSSKILGTLKDWRPLNSKVIIPHPIAMKIGLQSIGERQKVLREVTFNHVTAKKWLIYNLQQQIVIKGYKYKLQHDIASISKLLTFYTAYDIVKQYFITISNFDILVTERDAKIGGRCLHLHQDSLLTLQDALHALLMASSNNVALAIANNLGSFVSKKRKGKYFNCFDLSGQNRQENIGVFVSLMRKHASSMKLFDTVISNPHGSLGNISTALDIARLASECFKIPLFSKISATVKFNIRPRHINEDGQLLTRICLLENTNILLGKGCVGGKTGSNSSGGQSFVGCFEGSFLVIVLGCAGREQKFSDCMRLVEWIHTKIQLAEQL